MTKAIFVPPDSAAVVDGYLIPGRDFIKPLVDQLREDINKDPALKQKFQQDPRSILGERGIVRDLQTEIMKEQGIPVPEDVNINLCISTSSCCCESLGILQ